MTDSISRTNFIAPQKSRVAFKGAQQTQSFKANQTPSLERTPNNDQVRFGRYETLRTVARGAYEDREAYGNAYHEGNCMVNAARNLWNTGGEHTGGPTCSMRSERVSPRDYGYSDEHYHTEALSSRELDRGGYGSSSSHHHHSGW